MSEIKREDIERLKQRRYQEWRSRLKPWHMTRCGPLGWYHGDDWRDTLRIRWGSKGTYRRVWWRLFVRWA